MKKKIILAGNSCGKRQQFLDELTGHTEEYEVSEELQEADQTSCVLLFGDPDGKKELDELLGALSYLAKVRPYRAALISDIRVYGALFGITHPPKEHELGYACHMREDERSITNLRTAEHFACRLAREEGLDIRVLRDAWNAREDEAPKRIAEAMKLLLDSERGQVYNLPGALREETEAPSPLSPVRL